MSGPEWIDVGGAEDVPRRGARLVATPSGDIAVFRTATGAMFALRDRCPHKGGPLSQGIVHGAAVTCPLHNWVIDLATGEATGADRGCVPTVALRVAGGRVLLSAEVLSARPARFDTPGHFVPGVSMRASS